MITIYNQNEENFATLGLGALSPTECDVDWEEGGRYDLTMKHPILDDGKWMMIQTNCIIRAPSPVRESPAVEVTAGESATTTVSREIYKVATPKGGRLNLRKGPSTSSKVLASYKPGTLVAKTGVSGNWTKVLLIDGGRTGWMYTQYISYVRTETENVTTEDKPGVIIKRAKASDQLFRINIAEPDTTNGIVNVEAEHISYDLKWVKVIGKCDLKDVPVETALAKVQSMASREHDFEIHCLVSGNVTGDYTNKSLLECIRDPEIGFAPQLGARVVCDNFDIWILPDEVRDMGVELRYRKNLKGIKFKTDSSNQITRIYPVGKDKNGEPLYLEGTKYVESSYAEALVGRDAIIEYDVKVGTGEGEFKNNKAARTELERLAQADMDAGADDTMFSMDVNFLDLGDTEEYKQYKGLMIIHPYDTVSVIHGPFGKKEKARLNKCKWNAVTRKYKSTVFGSVQTTQATVYSFDIAPGAVGNGKIAAGAVDTAQLRNFSIQYAKIALAAIEQLNADSITALTARINEIVAGNITTDSLYAALAEIITLRVKTITADKIETDELYAALADVILLRAQQINADNINTDTLAAQYAEIVALLVENIQAENIQTDRLGAVLAEFVSMYASVGEFDFATIQNLVSKALAIEQGSMDTVYIKNLAVTSANLLSATLGKLVLKGDDGKYYRVFVGADGEVRTEEVALTEEEIADGKTEGGQQIVETDMNVGSLNASNLQANSAVINEILTIALTAEKITAADAMIASATIPALYAATIKAIGDSLDLSANISIRQMVSGRSKIFYQEDMPEEYDPGNLWIIPSTGKTYHAIGLPGGSLTEIVVNDDFEFVFRYPPEAEGLDFLIDQYGDLLTNTEYIQLDEDGTLFAFRGWVEVPVSELHTSYIDIMQDIIRIRSGGNVVIGAGGAFNVDAGSAHFKTSDFALSILAEDGSEDTVLDFDAESKTLRADEVKAGNIRDFFPGTTTITAAEIGGLDGLAGMLAAAQYEHVVYMQTTSDASVEAIEFNACDSMLVEIEGFTGCIIPPLMFNRLTGRIVLKNFSWNCPEQTAVYADSGNVMLRRCTADAQTGVHATGSANVVWIGDDEAMTAGGACTTAFLADEGADVKLFGLIPSGERTKVLAGTITEINVRTGAGVEVDQPDKTVTIKATLGYYGTNSGWNGGAMYQGYTSGKGRIYGCMQFDLPDDIAQIKAATLTLHRVSGAGSGSNINVTVYASATEFKSRPSLGDQVAHRDKAAGTGESCTLDVTEGAKALLDGTAKQLVLYTGESAAASGVVYSRHYGKFDSAKLKITY